MKFPLYSVISILLLIPQSAIATFTIAGTHGLTSQVGAAGASCVPSGLFAAVYHSVAGKGVFMTQAFPPDPSSPVISTGTSMLEEGETPADIIVAVSDPELDVGIFDSPLLLPNGTVTQVPLGPTPGVRQYGVVDMTNEPAGYTGALIETLYKNLLLTEEEVGNHTQTHQGGLLTLSEGGEVYRYQAQGNVVDPKTVPTLVASFQSADCDDLAGRLFAALEAVFEAESFAGDVRCRTENYTFSGSSTFLHIDNPDGNALLHLEFDSVDIDNGVLSNPFVPLKEAYLAWRANNPCPSGSASPEATDPTAAPEGDSGAHGAISANFILVFSSLAVSIVSSFFV
jgi:uncharacterized Ntn-hydrolase superfamily protein